MSFKPVKKYPPFYMPAKPEQFPWVYEPGKDPKRLTYSQQAFMEQFSTNTYLFYPATGSWRLLTKRNAVWIAISPDEVPVRIRTHALLASAATS